MVSPVKRFYTANVFSIMHTLQELWVCSDMPRQTEATSSTFTPYLTFCLEILPWRLILAPRRLEALSRYQDKGAVFTLSGNHST